jgi:hypothetical protein
MATKAPFETFREYGEREESGEPYNEAFIERCRAKALEYDKFDPVLRAGLLQELKKCVPIHYRIRVFDGIANFNKRG